MARDCLMSLPISFPGNGKFPGNFIDHSRTVLAKAYLTLIMLLGKDVAGDRLIVFVLEAVWNGRSGGVHESRLMYMPSYLLLLMLCF